jgi:hypothetical protein
MEKWWCAMVGMYGGPKKSTFKHQLKWHAITVLL